MENEIKVWSLEEEEYEAMKWFLVVQHKSDKIAFFFDRKPQKYIHVRLVKKPGYERATAKTRLTHIIPFLLSYSRWLYSRCADLTRGDPIACASLLTFAITSTAFDLLTQNEDN